jgi:hypothetical protein
MASTIVTVDWEKYSNVTALADCISDGTLLDAPKRLPMHAVESI